MRVGKRVEGVIDEFAQRLGPFHLLQLLHPVRVIHPLRFQLGHLLALGPVELCPEDRHRILQDRLDQGEDVERVRVARRIEARQRVEQPEREGMVDGEVGLQVLGDREVRGEVLVAPHVLDEPGGPQSPACRRRRAQMDPLVALVPVRTPHHLHEARVALRPRRFPGAGLPLGLQQVQDHPVGHLEARLERLGRLGREPLEGGAVPVDVAPRGRGLLHHLLPGLLLLLELQVLDDVLGRLGNDVSALVESLAPRPAGDLQEVPHRQLRGLLAVELDELREGHRADGNVHAHPERVGAAHHLEQAPLRELFDQESIARQESGVMQTDPVLQEPLQVLPVRSVEADTHLPQGVLQARLLLLRGEIGRHEVLRPLGGRTLREVHQVDGSAIGGDQPAQGLVERRLDVAHLQRHRTLCSGNARHLAPGDLGELRLDERGVAERRAHEQELRPLEEEQRDLPGHPAIAVGVVVELVHHHAVGAQPGIAQREIREHLLGADEHGRLAVDGRIAGDHPDVARSEDVAEREELLVDERLGGAGVDGDLPAAHGLEMEERRDQRLPRSCRRREDDVLAREKLEERLFLGAVEAQALCGHPVGEAAQDGVVGYRPGGRRDRVEPAGLDCAHGIDLAEV